MNKIVTFVDGDGVRDAIAGVEHDAGGATGGVQRQHGLDGHVHGGSVERLEHDLGHLLTVGLGVERSLSQQHRVLLGRHTQLVVEGVVPDLLHVVPVGDNAVLDGVLQGEDTTLGLGLVANIGVLLSHADHDALVTGPADDRWEDSPRSVVSGEASLAHAGAIVHNQSGNLVVTHV